MAVYELASSDEAEVVQENEEALAALITDVTEDYVELRKQWANQ
jgi:hypothetical protein